MIRNVSLEEISDGKLYKANEQVAADCKGCEGCSSCCRGMGTSIVLDPLDVHRLKQELEVGVEVLFEAYLELHVVDHMILPNLKMNPEQDCCVFLNQQGRCTIHTARPGFCRLFPLGRFYENRSFSYFLQIHECPKEDRDFVKVKQWIDTERFGEYENFINTWHYFLKDAVAQMKAEHILENDMLTKQVNMVVLKLFYMTPFEETLDFYEQFYTRIDQAKQMLGMN